MANPNDRYSINVPGTWYVDTNCVDCGQCDSNAPSVFRRSDSDGHNYVHRQPATAEEFALAVEAQEGCPAEAIGNDG